MLDDLADALRSGFSTSVPRSKARFSTAPPGMAEHLGVHPIALLFHAKRLLLNCARHEENFASTISIHERRRHGALGNHQHVCVRLRVRIAGPVEYRAQKSVYEHGMHRLALFQRVRYTDVYNSSSFTEG